MLKSYIWMDGWMRWVWCGSLKEPLLWAVLCGANKCDPCDKYYAHYSSAVQFSFHPQMRILIRPVLVVWVSKNCNLWQGGRVPIIWRYNSIHLVFKDKSFLSSTDADFFNLQSRMTKKYHKRPIGKLKGIGFYLQRRMFFVRSSGGLFFGIFSGQK